VSAKEEMKELKHPYVGSEHLLLAILKDDNEISARLKDFNLDYNRLKNEIIEIVKIKLNKLKNKYNKRGINIKINSGIIEDIINKSNYREFGARKIDKIIKNDIESSIINEIIDNKKTINIKKIKKEKVIN